MSNSQVGNVYQQIISEVIEASRVDFEEGGVDENVLDELKKGWQKKLTQQGLATFPWDPKPDPPAPAAPPPGPQQVQPAPVTAAPQAMSNGAAYTQPQQPQGLTMPMPSQPSNESQVKSEPGVKIEPGLENTLSMSQNQPQPQSRPAPQAANERVIANLQAQYGERAAASISKLRQQPNGAQMQGLQGQQPNQQTQFRQQYPVNAQQQGQRPTMPGNPNAPRQPYMPNGQGPHSSQMDGTGDDESHIGVLLHQDPSGHTTEMGRMEIDNLLHAQIAAKARAMEGGGLMVPLKRVKKGEASFSYHRKPNADAGPSHFDGADDELKDEEDDEDAINSDLDDPDDNLDADEDDDEGGQIMLCMYDKVQRVKNKWKCVLKDGVLNVNNKDYVFHKATGEYEW